MKLYRVMKVAADGKPQVGTSGSVLGVRPTNTKAIFVLPFPNTHS